MKIKAIDHLVITTADLDTCLAFYVGILGMELDESNHRYALRFGNSKFNIHTRKAEFCRLLKTRHMAVLICVLLWMYRLMKL